MTEIVAEISGNHGGDLANACALIEEAKKAGADAVKFQCFEPEQLAKKRANNSYVLKLANGKPLIDLYKEIHTPKDWFPDLIKRAGIISISWFSSVFHPDDVAFLETQNCPRYKISAFEMLDGDLINAVVATGKPIIMSVRPTDKLTIMRATGYPIDEKPSFCIGLSDHSTDGIASPRNTDPMVERHICLPDVKTPDSEFSSTPDEFANYVKIIKGLS
jgi:sialic acid synthase SpsE